MNGRDDFGILEKLGISLVLAISLSSMVAPSF